MSPVAEQLHIANKYEFSVGEIPIAQSPLMKEKAPYSLQVTRIIPEQLGPDAHKLFEGQAVYLLTHEPVGNEDPVDGVATVFIEDGGQVKLELDFPSTTAEVNRELFKRKTIDDLEINAGLDGRDIITVLPREQEAVIYKINEGLARAA